MKPGKNLVDLLWIKYSTYTNCQCNIHYLKKPTKVYKNYITEKKKINIHLYEKTSTHEIAPCVLSCFVSKGTFTLKDRNDVNIGSHGEAPCLLRVAALRNYRWIGRATSQSSRQDKLPCFSVVFPGFLSDFLFPCLHALRSLVSERTARSGQKLVRNYFLRSRPLLFSPMR